MDQEQLIRQIMAQVMKDLGREQVTFEKVGAPAASAAAPASSAGKVGKDAYPLAEKSPDLIHTASGKSFSSLTFDKVLSGELTPQDFRISKETLELQAQVADSVGRDTLARNMRRAAELIAVPDDELLNVYNALRPYRSTKQELYDIADGLQKNYGCTINAAFIKEAADVYEKRGRLRSDD